MEPPIIVVLNKDVNEAVVTLKPNVPDLRALTSPNEALGKPTASPPVNETNPKGPALTPVPASTLVFDVIKSH